ncbi:hypothetical protein [Actinacidiphila acidipaludis]|uniref:Peptidase n=1 Tax=Actinacidiphila acidipaludis TaxID=2873382 RepID=A0ABS7QDY0_9ACTN|nr:hypothetical protein [Streptomyces acidipaludis]MBY8881368.1 hypothetical protein [Streptomyces acidipaludis]
MERRPPSRPGRRAAAALSGLALACSATVALAAPMALAAPTGGHDAAPGGYRLKGERTTGGTGARTAAPIAPGQYLDTIGPDQTRWYAADLDAVSTADLSATAVPRPGAAVGFGDGIELRLAAAGSSGATCADQSAHFGQDQGAMTLTGAVSRIPSHTHDASCDKAGRYLLAVHRTTAAGSDRAPWPLELRFADEAPLPAGTVPAGARTDYGTPPAPLTGTPKDVTGGSGFNDATRLTPGVWRDHLLPARTRWYTVHVGWGQQLSYAAEFGNQPVPSGTSVAAQGTFVSTAAYAPGRLPVQDASDARGDRSYDGSPVSVGLGTVPVTWTNRWVDGEHAQAVHDAGDYTIAVSLGPEGAWAARATAVGVVLRVQVTGQELAGPQYQAPPLAGRATASVTGNGGGTARAAAPEATSARTTGPAGGPAPGAASGPTSRVTGTDLLAAGTGGGVALAGVVTAALLHRARNRTDRGGA